MAESRKKATLKCALSRVLRLSLLLVPFAAALPSQAQPSVRAMLSRTDIFIGDTVTLTVTARFTAPIAIRRIGLEALGEEEPALEVRDTSYSATEEKSGLLITEARARLSSLDSGYYFIPPIPVVYEQNGRQDTAFTNELALNVKEFPLGIDSLKLQPIKGIIEEPANFRDRLPYLIALLLLIGLAILLYFVVRWKPTPLPPPPARKVGPHELAMEQLDALERQKLWQQGQVKQYHSELTRILREYLERRYDIKALEQATEEILRELKGIGLDVALKGQLQQLLRTVDLVKFAKANPPASFHAAAMENVRGFVSQTRDETMVIELPLMPELTPAEIARRGVVIDESSLVLRDPMGYPLEIAGFWRRFFARLIDIHLLPAVYFSIPYFVVSNWMGENSHRAVWFLLFFLLFSIVFFWACFALMEHRLGGTPGKLLLGIRVVGIQGAYPSLGKATLRFVGKMISESIFLLGYVPFFFDKERRQTLHDRMADTFVIKKHSRPLKGSRLLDDGLET